MKQFTHAWLAFCAIKRLTQKTKSLSPNDTSTAMNLTEWFKDHRDDVLQGAWYPDEVIKDLATGHILKITPESKSENVFKNLPVSYCSQKITKDSTPLRNKSFTIDKGNLPDRCESMAHALVDNLKIQERESKGSSVVPTGNHIALRLFMQSHYIADAHVPLHCDNRPPAKLHEQFESRFEKEMDKYFVFDRANDRFSYNGEGFPMLDPAKSADYANSLLGRAEAHLANRTFAVGYGGDNNNVWDFMSAVCQNSYLLSYQLIPEKADITATLKQITVADSVKVDEIMVGVLSDAVDSIARVWLRVWRRYLEWKRESC